MLTKINVSRIVRDHLATLRINSDPGAKAAPISWADLVLFLVLPLGIGVSLAFVGKVDLGRVSDPLLTAFSIFAGLLLNLLVLLLNLMQRHPSDTMAKGAEQRKSAQRAILLEQTYANVAFAILVSVTVVALTLAFKLVEVDQGHALITGPLAVWGAWITTAVTLALAVNFLLTLLMILKRVHAIFQTEQPSTSSSP